VAERGCCCAVHSGGEPAYLLTERSRWADEGGGGWKFHIVHADGDEPFIAYTAAQTDATGRFTLGEMTAFGLHLGFRQ
jgi:hypothetical protein